MEGATQVASSAAYGPHRRRAKPDPELDRWIASRVLQIVATGIVPALGRSSTPSRETATSTPSWLPEKTERLRACLLAPVEVDVEAEAAAVLAGAPRLDDILSRLFIPAAQHLGRMWEDDECSFVTVTVGLGRLQVMTHLVCASLEQAAPASGRRILLLPSSGETHSYAISIVASRFRTSGWAVEVLALAGSDAAKRVTDEWFDAVGLSLSADVHAEALVHAIAAVRRASRNANLVVVVGGPWFERHGADAADVGADLHVADARTGPAQVEALLGAR